MYELSSKPTVLSTTHIAARLVRFSRVASFVVGLIGAIGLLGWIFNSVAFKQIVPGLATMEANTALCLMLCALALASIDWYAGDRQIIWAGRVCAALVVCVAALTLCEYTLGGDLGIDQLLFVDTSSAAFPGRMSIVTAAGFMLLSLALLLYAVEGAEWLVSVLVLAALLIAWIVLIGYLYGVSSLYQVSPFSAVALHTALALSLLGTGILFARPSYGLAGLIASDSVASLIVRRLLPAALVIPVLLGWVRWQGQLAGLYDAEFGLVLMVAVLTFVFMAIIWWNAGLLAQIDRERAQAAQALRSSEGLLHATFEQAPIGIARVGREGEWLQVNQKLCDIVGYTRAELLSRTFQSITYPDDLERDLEYMHQTLRGERATYAIEKRYIRKDGTPIWINLTVALVRDSGGEPAYFISVVEDISERKLAEAALRESEERLGAIVGSAMDAIVSIDAARTIVLFNRAAEQMFRCSAAAVIGQSIDRFIPEQLRARYAEHTQHFGATGAASRFMRTLGELMAVRADGEEFPIEATISQIVVAGQTIYTVIVRDISERKEVEAELRQSEERFSKAFHTAQIAMVISTTAEGYVLDANERFLRLFGYSRREVIGQSSLMLNMWEHADDRERAIGQFMQAGYVRDLEMRVRADGGLLRDVLLSADALELGNQRCMLTTLYDITDRKQAEAALRQSEQRFAIAFRFSPIAKAITRVADGKIMDVNDRYAELLGYAPEDLIGRTGLELNVIVDPADRAQLMQVLRECGSIHEYETLVRDKSGQVHDVLASIEVTEIGGTVCNLVILMDITERKRAELAIRRYAERLRRLREIDHAILAAGSIHDIARAVLDHVARLVPSIRASVTLLDDEAQQIVPLAVFSATSTQLNTGARRQIAELGGINDTLRAGKMFLIDDVSALTDAPEALRMLAAEGVCAYMAAPMLAQSRLIGTLNIGAPAPNAFTHEHREIALELAGQLAIAIDQSNLRAEIQRHAAELEQRVDARTAELAAANKELEAFSYSVSHDLRAPLRAIAGFSRILAEEFSDQMPNEAQAYLLLVRENAQQMDHLINDLLAFSRLSRQSLNRQLVAPANLVRPIAAELRAQYPDRAVEFVLGELPSCWADPALLRQVYVNLLTNAFKFTGKSANPRIECGAQVQLDQADEIVYFVKDNGAGFDMRYADKLFGVFQRLHRAEDYEGTGVGLAIVQRIIGRHGGRVWAKGAIGQGATFYFTLGGVGNHG